MQRKLGWGAWVGVLWEVHELRWTTHPVCHHSLPTTLCLLCAFNSFPSFSIPFQVDNSREHRRCLRLLSVESVTPDWTLSALPTPDWVDPGDPDAEGGLTESGDSGVNLVAFGEGSEGRPVAGVAATTVKEVRPGAMEALVVRATLKSAADLKDAEGEGTVRVGARFAKHVPVSAGSVAGGRGHSDREGCNGSIKPCHVI